MKKLFGMELLEGSGGRSRSFQFISTFYKENSQILILLFVGPSRLYYILCTCFLCNMSRLRGVKAHSTAGKLKVSVNLHSPENNIAYQLTDYLLNQ